jgi:hypothetical protein
MANKYEDSWSNYEINLFDDMTSHNSRMADDEMLQNLYDAALFNHDVSKSDRAVVLNFMRDYMWDNYGMDFDQAFDWDGFREAYDSTQA